MVVYNFSRQGSFAVDQGSKSWDPRKIFEITNPDTGKFTCVGFAPSCGRRCRNPIAQCNQQKVFEMLNEIALSPASSRAVASKLSKIAFLSLCVRNHRDQVEEVVAEWQNVISSMAPRTTRVKSWRVNEDSSSPKTAPRKTRGESRQTPEADTYENPRASAKPTPTPTEEDQRQKTQEKKQQEQERLRKEKLKREEEERAREAEKERQRRAADRKKEEEDRLKRAKAVKEKREWEQVWKTYDERWDIFRATKSIPASSIRSAIPWPVKNGQYSNVKYSAVKEFFLKCPNADNPALMFKLMQKESVKWHPDKISTLFREKLVDEGEKLIVDLIARVVIEMRAEAQAKRNG